MNDESVEQKIRELVSKKLNVDVSRIQGDTRLEEDLGLDSFGGVELMFEIEEAFNLKIPDSDLQHVRTVHDIATYIISWKEKAAAAPTSTSQPPGDAPKSN
jgi:acyl carrier protein